MRKLRMKLWRWRHRRTRVLKLGDVMPAQGTGPAADIKIVLETVSGGGCDGVCIGLNEFDYRIVLENNHGRLMLYVWPEYESCSHGGDPVHSIEILPDRGVHDGT